MIKTLSKLGIEEDFLNLIKTNYNSPTANILYKDKKLKAFLLRPGAKQQCSFSPLFFNIILEAFANAKLLLKLQEGKKMN